MGMNPEWVHELEDRAEQALTEAKQFREPEFVRECRVLLAELYARDDSLKE